MYGIYANIWGILMVHVTIYTIHGSYGLYKAKTLQLLYFTQRQQLFWSSRQFLEAPRGSRQGRVAKLLPSPIETIE